MLLTFLKKENTKNALRIIIRYTKGIFRRRLYARHIADTFSVLNVHVSRRYCSAYVSMTISTDKEFRVLMDLNHSQP